MNKVIGFDVVVGGVTRRIDADQYHILGEYVEFYEVVGYGPAIDTGEIGDVVTPYRRLLTMLHRPSAVIPLYEDAE